jgi:plastocyanin
MRRILVLLVAGSTLALPLAATADHHEPGKAKPAEAAGPPAQTQATGPVITVGHSSVEPAQVEIQAGGTVTFYNKDEMPGGHRVAEDQSRFVSPSLRKGEHWTTQISKPGTYKFSLKQHPGVRGEIVVKPAPPAAKP